MMSNSPHGSKKSPKLMDVVALLDDVPEKLTLPPHLNPY
jgi:hypothetical protein